MKTARDMDRVENASGSDGISVNTPDHTLNTILSILTGQLPSR